MISGTLIRSCPVVRRRSMPLTLLLLAVSITTSGCSWLDVKHRGWIYRATPGLIADWEPISPREEAFFIDVPSPPGEGIGTDGIARDPTDLQSVAVDGVAMQRLRVLWIPQADPVAPAVMYLHGTFRNVFQNRSKIQAIHRAGMAVFAVEYRGWGDSTAIVPSEQSIVADVEQAWPAFTGRAPDPSRRILFGHSMGAAVAVDMASRRRVGIDYAALVLESGFKSLPAVARDFNWFARMLAPLTTQQFDSIAKMPRLGGPVWLLTGTVDNTVPSAHTRALYDAAPWPRQLVEFENGGHSRLHRQFPMRYAGVWRCIGASLAWRGDEDAASACLAALPDEQALPDR